MNSRIYLSAIIILPLLILCSCSPRQKTETSGEDKPAVSVPQSPNEPDTPEPGTEKVIEPEGIESPRKETQKADIIEPSFPNEPAEPCEANLPGKPLPGEPAEDTSVEKEAKTDTVEKWKGTEFHKQFAPLLKEYVREDSMVDYDVLRHNKAQLTHLLAEFNRLPRREYESWRRKDKIAFWINAYNMKMLDIITDNYPIEASRWLAPFWGAYSIRHIDKIWSKYKIMILNEQFNLHEIETKIFDKKFGIPRVYFAVYQASYSSPPLRNEPYYGYKLDKQLNEQITKFLNSARGLKMDRGNNTVYISAVFEPNWRGREFLEKYGTETKFKDKSPVVRAALNFICKYVSRNRRNFLQVENYSVEYINYDWTLNDTSISQ